MVSLPHCAREPPLAQHMSPLPRLPGAPAYGEVVLLVHRAALQLRGGRGGWSVRLGMPEDAAGLHGLTGGLPGASAVQESFLHALGECVHAASACWHCHCCMLRPHACIPDQLQARADASVTCLLLCLRQAGRAWWWQRWRASL